MRHILYVTSNALKLRLANEVGRQFDLSFKTTEVDIHEIQAEEGETVARDKAAKAFAIVQQPLVVSDDSWLIPGLNNFPGPYMKSMSHWFSAEDWLRLTTSLTDRRVILRQIVVYQDHEDQQLFYTDIEGSLLSEIRDKAESPFMSIISFDGGKTSAAELINNKKSPIFEADRPTTWHDFAKWYNAHHA